VFYASNDHCDERDARLAVGPSNLSRLEFLSANG